MMWIDTLIGAILQSVRSQSQFCVNMYVCINILGDRKQIDFQGYPNQCHLSTYLYYHSLNSCLNNQSWNQA